MNACTFATFPSRDDLDRLEPRRAPGLALACEVAPDGVGAAMDSASRPLRVVVPLDVVVKQLTVERPRSLKLAWLARI